MVKQVQPQVSDNVHRDKFCSFLIWYHRILPLNVVAACCMVGANDGEISHDILDGEIPHNILEAFCNCPGCGQVPADSHAATATAVHGAENAVLQRAIPANVACPEYVW